MKKINFWLFSLVSILIWYAIVSYVRWELDWYKHFKIMSNLDRLWVFLAVVAKTVLDYIIWSQIKSKDRSEENQLKYHYDEDGNDIKNQTSIN